MFRPSFHFDRICMTVSPRYLERTDHANGSSPVLNLGWSVERPDETRARKKTAGWSASAKWPPGISIRGEKRNESYAASSNPSLWFSVTVISWFLEMNCCLFFFSRSNWLLLLSLIVIMKGFFKLLFCSFPIFLFFLFVASKTRLEILVPVIYYINLLHSRQLFHTFRWISYS